MTMTPSDLDEIRKRCEAATPREPVTLSAADRAVAYFLNHARGDVARLLDEVERLQRERDAAWRQHDFVTEREKQLVANLERVDSRLALLEPVWEAAKEWRARHEERWKQTLRRSPDPAYVYLPDDVAALSDAIDAAAAKEGK